MDRVLKIFKALSDKSRLRIVKMLQVKSLCVCEITAILGLATPTVSKHLSILKEADIIKDLKNARWVDYHLNKEGRNLFLIGLLPLLSYWLQDDDQVISDSQKSKTIKREELCRN